MGEIGELIIGGVGLARYLDPDKDAEKYAPMPTLGWDRAYRSGDLVRLEPDGPALRRAAPTTRSSSAGGGSSWARSTPRCWRCRASRGAAAAVRTHRQRQPAPGRLPRQRRRRASTWPRPRTRCASRCRPRWCRCWPSSTSCRPAPRARSTGTRCRGRCPGETPTRRRRTSAAPRAGWPSSGATCSARAGRRPGRRLLRAGGGSLSAAQLVAALRAALPEVTVADVYEHPRLGALAGYLDELDPPPQVETRTVRADAARRRPSQVAAVAAAGHAGRPALAGLAGAVNNVAATVGRCRGAPTVAWWWVARRLAAVRQPARADGDRGAVGAGCCCAACSRARYPRGGAVHLRLWFAERLADASGAENLAGAPWMVLLRAGAGRQGRPGRRPALAAAGHRHAHARPALLGRARGRPVRALARRRRPARRRDHGSAPAPPSAPAARCCPGAAVGKDAEVAAGLGGGRRGARRAALGGSPAVQVRQGPAPLAGPTARGRAPLWVLVYGADGGAARRACPLAALGCGLAVIGWASADAASLTDAVAAGAAAGRRSATLVALVVVRAADRGRRAAASLGLREGYHPVRSRVGLAGVGDRAADGRGPHLPVPAVRQPAHAGLAAGARARRSAAASRPRRCCCCRR